MASGYDKAACGVDPAKGWSTPTLRDRLLSFLILAIAVPFVWGGLLLVLWRVFSAGGQVALAETRASARGSWTFKVVEGTVPGQKIGIHMQG